MQDFSFREPNFIFKCFHVGSALFFALIVLILMSYSIWVLNHGYDLDGSCWSTSEANYELCSDLEYNQTAFSQPGSNTPPAGTGPGGLLWFNVTDSYWTVSVACLSLAVIHIISALFHTK
jgi:hypothetical protein